MTLPQISAIIGLIVLVCYAIIVIGFLRHWMKCFSSDCPVQMMELMGARMRGIPLEPIVDAYISAFRKKLPISFRDLQMKYQENPKEFPQYVKAMRELDESDF